jgi:hypothetical protein
MFALFLLLCCCSPALAQRGAQAGKVTLVVLSQQVSGTSSPDNDLVHFKVKLTNAGAVAVPYTNNRFVLTDSEGANHLVSRPWYPAGAALEPGQSVEIDRIYFEIPKKAKPAELSLMWRRAVVGSAKLK